MLILGPIIGHTTDTATRVWVQVDDDPSDWVLHLGGAEDAPFRPTEDGPGEFGTAIAAVEGLTPDTRHDYEIRRRGEAEPHARGSFRTMPPPGDDAGILFVSASCDNQDVAGDSPKRGAWDLLARAIEEVAPRFLVMLGDQVYLDQDPDIWNMPLEMDRRERRRRMAAVYRRTWSRAPVARILANIPSWMMWDDHDIREGWGSNPGDSPTLAARFPAGREIAARYAAYFEDARQVYWHFQHVRNPPTPGVSAAGFLEAGARRAVPYRFDAGKLRVLVLDNRGARDEWRKSHPALGDDQWTWLRAELEQLDPAIDALVVVVPLPVASMANKWPVQMFLGHRHDDVRLFARGDAKGLRQFGQYKPTNLFSKAMVYVDALRDFASSALLHIPGSGPFMLADVTDVRDNWANHHVRPERDALVRAALRARTVNRPPGAPRAVSFIGGDIHIGALMDILAEGGTTVPTLITSGIGQSPASEPVLGTVIQKSFRMARGLRAELRFHCVEHNFGITRLIRKDGAPAIEHELRHTDGMA